MNNSSLIHFRQYAALFFKLLLPLNVLRWIFAVTAVIWGVALWLRASDWGFLLGIAAAITGLIAFLLLILIPMQVIALASSRPVSLLRNSRSILLVILIGSSVAISCAFYSVTATRYEPIQLPSLSLVVWLIVSLLLQLCVFIRSRWESNWFFVLVLAWVWMKIGLWLTEVHPLLLLSALSLSWLVFARWWLQWRPKKYRPSILTEVISDSESAGSQSKLAFLFQSGKADTWIGSQLLGVPDGGLARNKRLLLGGLIFLLTQIPVYVFIGKEQIEALIRYALIPFVMFMSISAAQGVAANFIRNLHGVWLYCPGGRQGMLSVALKLYVREVGIRMLLTFGLALVIELVWVKANDLEVWAYTFATTMLMNMICFYLAWWVHLRSQGSLLWSFFASSVAVLMLMALFVATGLLFPLPFDWKGISIVWILLAQLILIALLYKSVRSGFSRMNFVRVG
jgi:hypothetical protein